MDGEDCSVGVPGEQNSGQGSALKSLQSKMWERGGSGEWARV